MATMTSGASATIASSGNGLKPTASAATFVAPANVRMASGAGVPAADHCATVLHGQDEKRFHRLRDLGSRLGQHLEIIQHLLGKFFAL